MPTDHERVQAALRAYDETPRELGDLEKLISLAVYDTDEVEPMTKAYRIAVAVAAALGGEREEFLAQLERVAADWRCSDELIGNIVRSRWSRNWPETQRRSHEQ